MGTAPFFDFNRQEAGVLLAIGWTGQWHAVFDRDHASVRMRSGIEHAAFRVRPGERFRTGSAAVTTYWRGQDEAHNRWRRFMGEISPLGGKGRGEQAPFSGIFWGGVPSDRLMARWEKLLDAGLPLDTCWIDAGWYEPLRAENCSGQSAEWPNVGIWEVNKKYHPDGYQDVIRFLRQRHVNFMVWMEPERVRRSVKEWAKTLPGPDPALDDLLIALNDDSVADQVIELVSSKIEELHLSCYRQDYNILPLEYWLHNDQPERAGMTEIKYINNLYRFWDALLERFPHLLIDNCAGGGHRNDLEMLSRAVPLWRSDYQCTWDCCPEANQVQNAGAAWWYPYSGIGFGPTLGDLYSWRSAYTNGLAVRTWEHADPEWEVGAMGEPMDWAKRYFEEFSSVRHYFTKDYYPLIPQSMENLSWAASQYHDPSEGSGVILAFRRAKSPHDRALVVLGGLNRHMDYQFTDADTGETFLLPGLALVTEGMALSIPNRRQSLLLRYQALRPSRQEPEAPC